MKDFEVFFKNNSAIMILIDAENGNITDANTAALNFYGYSYQKMISLNIAEINTLPQNEIKKQFAGIIEGKIATAFYKHKIADGSVKDIQAFTSSVIMDNRTYIYSIIQDITPLKIKEKENARFEKIAGRLPGVVYQYKLKPDGSSCFPYASEAIKKIYNVNPEDVREDASVVFKRIHPKDMDHVAASIQKSAATLSEWRDEYRVILDDGSEHWLLGNAMPQPEQDGAVLWHGFITDITERKALEKDLVKATKKIEMAMEQSHLTYWEMNHAMNTFTFNDRFYKLYGTTAAKEGGYQMAADIYAKEFLFEEDAHLVRDAIFRFVGEKLSHMQLEHRIRTRDGKMKFIDVRISAQYNTNGELTGTYGCNQDITEKRKKEDEIIRLNTELKELTNHLQRLRAEERNKLALEVHDKIGQRLVGMKFEIDYLKSHSKEPGTEIENKISHLSGEIAKMLKDFNAIYSEVNPTFIDDLNLFDAIDSLATEFGKKNNLIIRFYSNIEEEKFSHETKWNIYKILEECLHNIAEHSKAENVTIKVFKTNELLQIEVEDDGMGFDISKVNMSKQIGIIEMRERVSAAGGVMVFDSVQGRGTLIKITISNLRQP
jgi:PAS domain S-box-containing protein